MVRANRLITLLFFTLLLVLSGCSALSTSVKKKDLTVETKMSATIVLDPVAADKRTVFLQLRNTSDKQGLDYQTPVAAAITAKGYTIVEDPDKAHFWIQANILQVGKSDLRTINGKTDQGYGAAFEGAYIGSQFGDGKGAVAATIVGGLIGVLTDAMVDDIVYVMITDLQISEKAKEGVDITETNDASLKQGDSGKQTQESVEIVDRKKYQTRITSTANQVNLTFEEAEQQLLEGLIQSMSGIL